MIEDKCKVSDYFLKLSLSNDIYYRLYQEQDFDLAIEYIRGLFEFLSKILNAGALPIIKDSKWILKA